MHSSTIAAKLCDICMTVLQKVEYRKTLEDDGAGRQKTEVQQV